MSVVTEETAAARNGVAREAVPPGVAGAAEAPSSLRLKEPSERVQLPFGAIGRGVPASSLWGSRPSGPVLLDPHHIFISPRTQDSCSPVSGALTGESSRCDDRGYYSDIDPGAISGRHLGCIARSASTTSSIARPRVRYGALRLLVFSFSVSFLLLTNGILRTLMQTPLPPYVELVLLLIFPLMSILLIRNSRRMWLVFLFALGCVISVIECFGVAVTLNVICFYWRFPVREDGCSDVDKMPSDPQYQWCRRTYILASVICAVSLLAFFLSVCYTWQCYSMLLETSVWKHIQRNADRQFGTAAEHQMQLQQAAGMRKEPPRLTTSLVRFSSGNVTEPPTPTSGSRGPGGTNCPPVADRQLTPGRTAAAAGNPSIFWPYPSRVTTDQQLQARLSPAGVGGGSNNNRLDVRCSKAGAATPCLPAFLAADLAQHASAANQSTAATETTSSSVN